MNETTKTSWLKIIHESFSGREGVVLLFLSLNVLHNYIGSQQSFAKKLGIDKFYMNKILKRLKDKGWIIVTDNEIKLVPELANKWSRYHLACKRCFTANVKHRSNGLCRECYYKEIAKPKRDLFKNSVATTPKKGRFPLNIKETGRWAQDYTECIECKSTKIEMEGRGFCKKCYQRNYRKVYREQHRDKWLNERGKK